MSISRQGTPLHRSDWENGYVVASYASGHLRVFNIRQQCLYIEAAAHSRAITGMDMHPSDNLFVTVGEDSILSVWSFPKKMMITVILEH